MNNNKNFGMFDLIFHSVTKKEIMKQDTKRINEYLEMLRKDLENSCSKLMITFDGYENDPREIYEIEEIRKYVSKLFSENKDLFYYITTMDNNNSMLLACMSDCTKIRQEGSKIITLGVMPDIILKNQITHAVMRCVNNDIQRAKVILDTLFVDKWR